MDKAKIQEELLAAKQKLSEMEAECQTLHKRQQELLKIVGDARTELDAIQEKRKDLDLVRYKDKSPIQRWQSVIKALQQDLEICDRPLAVWLKEPWANKSEYRITRITPKRIYVYNGGRERFYHKETGLSVDSGQLNVKACLQAWEIYIAQIDS